MQNQILYEALVNFPLETLGGSYTFLDRLSRENNWSRSFCLRAIAEYRRFLYLSQISTSPVTPSYVVDQVWHLHLLYTRSYWYSLCQPILGRPLHHGPTAGGAEEDEKFTNWYDVTLTLYRSEFGAAPPSDIWPERFSPEKPVRWVDLTRNWVIRKPAAGQLFCFVPILALGVFPVVMVILTALVFITVIAIWNSDTDDPSKKRASSDGSGCGAFSGCSSSSDCGSSGGDCGGGDGGGGCGGGGCGGGGCGGGD